MLAGLRDMPLGTPEACGTPGADLTSVGMQYCPHPELFSALMRTW